MINSPFRNQLGTHNLCSVSLGLNVENLNNKIYIYPNPAKSELNVNISQNEISEVSISNLLGQVLIIIKNTNTINISDLPNGVYIITITQRQLNLTQNLFIKE
jgi:hypothetical protein